MKWNIKKTMGIAWFFAFVSCMTGVNAQDFSSKFYDVAAKAGIDFKYTFGDTTYQNILESSGSGVTIFDYNQDGWMDIYLLNGAYLPGISEPHGRIFSGAHNALYRNHGDGTFIEVSEAAGLADTHWSMEAAAFDYDGDGDTDIYLLNYGPNVFYRNNGDGTFSDITEKVGLKGPELLNGFEKWSVSAAFWDIDEDGRTDVMVGNFLAFDPEYVSPTMPEMMPHPSEYAGQASLFYRQKADGSFEEITRSLGFYYPDSKCMGLTVFDADQDGALDLFQGNDHQTNFLFRNQGKGQFVETAKASGVAVNDQGQVTGSMHGSIGDIDGDGLIDLLVTDLKYGALYRNLGHGVYTDITRQSGLADAFAGKGQWAALLLDVDNDGDLDIFAANGTAEELRLQPPLLLENDGHGTFCKMGARAGAYFNTVRSGRGAAVVDYDNDGALDIVVSHVDLQKTPALLHNQGNQNHWIGVRLKAAKGPAAAVGVLVKITTGDKTQVLVHQPANSYLSYSDPRMHAGLGSHAFIDRLEVIWPHGKKSVFTDVKADRYVVIAEDEGIMSAEAP